MLINWFTVIAQIINFLILVFLLQRFLYKPIMQTIKKRQTMIETRWEDAEIAQKEAQQEADTYRQQQQKLQQQKEAMTAEMVKEVDREHQQLLIKARREVEEMQVKWKEALLQEKNDFIRSLRQQIAEQTNLIARQALQDLANADLEQQMISNFCQHLQKIDDNQQQIITQSLQKSHQPIIIKSSFEISPESRQQIAKALQIKVISDNPLEFHTSPDLICGIQVKLAAYVISWNLDDYLQTLESRFQELGMNS
ncbi:F0F1 ATP synthase subunit B [Rivularia sp. UHCC 0363]|uniref:F0F1 ATP synthase subunit B family protein n=1 Tax=Rivularia sp. UHCC 0363 TaxID=3110244 RepID=UPI002B1F7FBC|nr:F0F1 ATP synthase subunit B [Rivularia sp. UHCC 0363]MEA5594033.1 F0F1 ATP synthase subunit B [Rivularia sp. UHCC 0363]